MSCRLILTTFVTLSVCIAATRIARAEDLAVLRTGIEKDIAAFKQQQSSLLSQKQSLDTETRNVNRERSRLQQQAASLKSKETQFENQAKQIESRKQQLDQITDQVEQKGKQLAQEEQWIDSQKRRRLSSAETNALNRRIGIYNAQLGEGLQKESDLIDASLANLPPGSTPAPVPLRS